MSVITLTAHKRTSLGKGGARKARAAGDIPGILYGHGETPIPVSIGSREFQLAMLKHKGGNPLVSLAVEGSEYTALVRDAQYDPLTHRIIHLDFQHISLTESIEVQVSVRLVGTPIGVKDGGGIVEHITRSIEVRCLPTAIPPSIDVDIAALNIGDSVHVRDLKVADLELLSDPDATVATVVPPTVVEEKPAEEAAATTETAEPEVISKGKKDDEAEAEKSDKPEKGEKKGEKK